MRLFFIDEFGGVKNRKLYGLSIVCLDNSKYRSIYDNFSSSLKKIGWPEQDEFKGRLLFSKNNTEGKIITTEEIIDFVKIAVDFLSGKNSKCEIISIYNEDGNDFKNYCNLLGNGISKIASRSKKNPQKGNCCLFYDGFQEGWKINNINKISKISAEKLKNKNYFLIEKRATPVDSHNECVGICYADILSFLIRWSIEMPSCDTLETIDKQIIVENNKSKEKNTLKTKKNETIEEIMTLIKKIKIEKV